MHLLAASDWEGLIILLVFAILSALSAWWKNKKGAPPQQAEEPEGPPVLPGSRRPGLPPAKSLSWEEEIRRLLEGESSAPPPAAPPPIIIRELPRPTAPTAAPPPPPRRVLVPAPRPEPTLAELVPATEAGPSGHLANLRAAAKAFQRAAQLSEQVSLRMQRVDRLAERATAEKAVNTRRQRSPEVAKVVELFHSPASARQAFIASQIFGLPRAFEPR